MSERSQLFTSAAKDVEAPRKTKTIFGKSRRLSALLVPLAWPTANTNKEIQISEENSNFMGDSP
jgi:hypothetical protein